MGQKKPPRLGSTICTDKSWPEKATKTRQYDLLRPNMGQKKPPRLGSTICYGQEFSRKSHQDSAVRCVTAKSWPEQATKTRQYDFLWLRIGHKKPPRLVNTICYGQTCARKSHQDSAVRFVTAKKWPEQATKTWQYLIVAKNLAKPPRLGSTICYGQTWTRKSHQDSAVRFVTAKRGPERATKTRQYDLLRPNVGQKESPRLGSTICYGQELVRKSHRESWPERATKSRQYGLLRPTVGQKEPPRLGSTICHYQELARKSHRDSAVRFVTAKSWPERATKTRQYDLLRRRAGQKEPPRLGSTICYGQTWARKSHQDSAVRFVKSWPEKATKTRQYDLLRPRVRQKRLPYDLSLPRAGKKEPLRIGSTICM